MANFQTFSLKDLFSCSKGSFLTFCTLPFCIKFQPFSQGIRGQCLGHIMDKSLPGPRCCPRILETLDTLLSAQKQHILVLRNTPNCSLVHSGMTGIASAELTLHNRCGLESEQKHNFWSKLYPILDCKDAPRPNFFTPSILGDK